ncbi:hypothetical protein B481_1889 [Planococcus halocryophilus Or1]|uniref:Cell wall elongation regulator TseB-like domain-containing protein n=1 Tax=Planococcus halocryophilus TaxID=1215089 RepID=A0A1C7DPM4_9BACL|nr:DUF5590 domain-containing protein [Planococcus halocryophilus]ANU13367.1 hypothetical protein BBI08_05730 [Planococcus halocryophilus]EMF46174.1 hypothetical protein B481_1889 [Planococcus halocryophilus Or1]
MRQWITFILGFLSFLAVTIIILVLFLGNKPYSDTEELAIERAKSEKLIEDVERAYVYTNVKASVTVLGTNGKGELMAVFVPEGDGKLQTLALVDKITAKQARELVLNEMDVKKILHTKLGMESEEPVWEVAFVDEKDTLNYVYLSADDGQWRKRILNL